MKLTIVTLCLLLLVLSTYYFFTGYRSAFEADQACHSEKWNSYGDNPKFDCDHDLETGQWILYEVLPNHMPAKVINRFRY